MKYKYVVPALSYLPDWMHKFLMRHFKGPCYDPADGWNIWLDVSYWKYVRKHQKDHPEI